MRFPLELCQWHREAFATQASKQAKGASNRRTTLAGKNQHRPLETVTVWARGQREEKGICESVCVCAFSSSFSVGLFLFSPCLLPRATREDLALLRFVLALSRGLSLSFSLCLRRSWQHYLFFVSCFVLFLVSYFGFWIVLTFSLFSFFLSAEVVWLVRCSLVALSFSLAVIGVSIVSFLSRVSRFEIFQGSSFGLLLTLLRHRSHGRRSLPVNLSSFSQHSTVFCAATLRFPGVWIGASVVPEVWRNGSVWTTAEEAQTGDGALQWRQWPWTSSRPSRWPWL